MLEHESTPEVNEKKREKSDVPDPVVANCVQGQHDALAGAGGALKPPQGKVTASLRQQQNRVLKLSAELPEVKKQPGRSWE